MVSGRIVSARHVLERAELTSHVELMGSNQEGYLGKIKVWNASGVEPRGCQTLQRIAAESGSQEQVWKGSRLPTDQQGISVLGTLLGHTEAEDF